MTCASPWPTEIRVRSDRRSAQVTFEGGEAFEISARLLRAMTPSASERGHGGANFEPSQKAPREVAISAISAIGRYAVRIAFDDGHDTGLYSWDRLHRIGRERAGLEGRLAD